jgi:hypothetical protein
MERNLRSCAIVGAVVAMGTDLFSRLIRNGFCLVRWGMDPDFADFASVTSFRIAVSMQTCGKRLRTPFSGRLARMLWFVPG